MYLVRFPLGYQISWGILCCSALSSSNCWDNIKKDHDHISLNLYLLTIYNLITNFFNDVFLVLCKDLGEMIIAQMWYCFMTQFRVPQLKLSYQQGGHYFRQTWHAFLIAFDPNLRVLKLHLDVCLSFVLGEFRDCEGSSAELLFCYSNWCEDVHTFSDVCIKFYMHYENHNVMWH
jgi:hypothetical protein